MDTVWRNLRIAFPEKGVLALNLIRLRFYLHILRLFRDWLRLPSWDEETLFSQTRFVPSLSAVREWANQIPIILFTGHLGNWEMANLYGKIIVGSYGVFVRPQKRWLARWLARRRERLGIHLWEVGRDEKKALRQGKTTAVGIVIDHGAREGIPVRFFSKGCYFPKGPIWFARRLGARLLGAMVCYEGGKFVLTLLGPPWLPEGSDEEVAQRMTSQLEAMVRRYPEQYLWTFKRWKFSWDIKVVLLRDSRPGHFRQSRAVVSALRQAFPDKAVEVVEVELGEVEGSRWKRALSYLLPFLPLFLGEALVKAILGKKASEVLGRYCDVVVSAGSAVKGFNLFLKRYNQARAICIMDPGWGLRRWFDLILAPEHDGLQGRNAVSVPGAVAYFDGDSARARAEELEIPPARLGVLIGGPVRGFEMAQPVMGELLSTLEKVAGEVLITTSRRTPKWIEDWLRRREFKYKVIANDFNPQGAVDAILSRAERLLVTPDSASMIGEALATGKVVGIWAPVLPGGKHGRLVSSLISKGALIRIREGKELERFVAGDLGGQAGERLDLVRILRERIQF